MSQDALLPAGTPRFPPDVRRRTAIELGVLVVLTAAYLILFPVRHMGMDIGMALVALGLVGFTARDTRERIWGPPESPEFERVRRCTSNMALATLPAMLAFALFGIVDAYWEHRLWGDVAARFFNPRFPIALFLYIPWAMLQQTLFQFYLLGRLRVLLPFASPTLLSVLNGIAYGAVHLPDPDVTLVTIAGGIVWSYSYLRDRYVLPIALSHALLGATYFYWACGSDLVKKLVERTM